MLGECWGSKQMNMEYFMKKIVKEINLYHLESLLKLINDITVKMIKNKSSILEVPVVKKIAPNEKHVMYVSAWNLTDLAYLSIKNSNGKGKCTPCLRDLYGLVNLYTGYDNEKSKTEYEKYDNDQDKILSITIGHSQKQFLYQETHLLYNNYFRNSEILKQILEEVENDLNINEIFIQNTSFNYEEFNTLLLALLTFIYKSGEISTINVEKMITDNSPIINEENLLKVLKLYSSSYDEIRTSTLEENIFLTKPVIRMRDNTFLIINSFLLIKLLSDGVYWQIRNHFFSKKSQDFINVFGEYSEKYVQKVLEKYVKVDNFSKIMDNGVSKISDWKIISSKYTLLIEQKSTLASIKIKTLYPDLIELKKYIKKYEEAVEQLNSSERQLNIDYNKSVKMILYFENLYVSEVIKDTLMKELNLNHNENSNLFFISIEEFEILMAIYSISVDFFDKIIEEKIELEKTNSPSTGSSFNIIFNKYKIFNNLHITELINKNEIFNSLSKIE